MKVSEIEEHAGQDPIVKIFGTSAANSTGRDVFASRQVAVVPKGSFADSLATQATRGNSDLILVPWSETGTLAKLPALFTSKGAGLLENRDFVALASQIFYAARHISGVGVFVDKSLLVEKSTEAAPVSLSRQLTRDTTGVSLAENYDNSVKFHSTDRHGQKLIRTLYAGSEHDVYAVRLAFQLAQSENVVLEAVELAGATATSEFMLLKSVMTEELGQRVTFTSASTDAVLGSLLAYPDSSEKTAPT